MSLFKRQPSSASLSSLSGQQKRAPKIIAPSNLDGRKTVPAAGFSRLELERAGLTEAQARAAGLRLDEDRCSALGDNVMLLERLRETL